MKWKVTEFTTLNNEMRLTRKIKAMKIISMLAMALLFVPLTSCIKTTGYKNVIEHPGKLELIYYGYQLNNPNQYKIVANGKEFFITKTTVVPSIQSVFLLENTVINKGDKRTCQLGQVPSDNA